VERFVVTIPEAMADALWNPPPDRELLFVELDERPPCKRGDDFELRLGGRTVGQARVAYLVAPGAQFHTWRLFWFPASFIPYQ